MFFLISKQNYFNRLKYNNFKQKNPFKFVYALHFLKIENCFDKLIVKYCILFFIAVKCNEKKVDFMIFTQNVMRAGIITAIGACRQLETR